MHQRDVCGVDFSLERVWKWLLHTDLAVHLTAFVLLGDRLHTCILGSVHWEATTGVARSADLMSTIHPLNSLRRRRRGCGCHFVLDHLVPT